MAEEVDDGGGFVEGGEGHGVDVGPAVGGRPEHGVGREVQGDEEGVVGFDGGDSSIVGVGDVCELDHGQRLGCG